MQNCEKAKKNLRIINSFNAFFQHATCIPVQLLDKQSRLHVVCASYLFSVHRWDILIEHSTFVRHIQEHNKQCKISKYLQLLLHCHIHVDFLQLAKSTPPCFQLLVRPIYFSDKRKNLTINLISCQKLRLQNKASIPYAILQLQ